MLASSFLSKKKWEHPNLLSSNALIILLTTMLKGATKTLIETANPSQKFDTKFFFYCKVCDKKD